MDLQNNVLTNSQTQWNSATRSWPGEIHTQFNSMSFFFFSMLPSFAGIVPGNTSRYLKNTGKESEFSGCSVWIWGFLITLSSHTADKKPSLTTMLHIKTAPGGQKKKNPSSTLTVKRTFRWDYCNVSHVDVHISFPWHVYVNPNPNVRCQTINTYCTQTGI